MKHCTAFVLFICMMAMVSCRSSSQEKLHIDTMKVVMWDMLRIDEVYSRMQVKDTTLKNKHENIRLYEEVFALHHITKEQFQLTYKYYESHPLQFKVLLDSIDNFANRYRTKSLGE